MACRYNHKSYIYKHKGVFTANGSQCPHTLKIYKLMTANLTTFTYNLYVLHVAIYLEPVQILKSRYK